MNPLLISFSGGKTSAFMSRLLQDYYADREKVFVFANTGREHPKTLEFVNECDRRWELGVVWVEAAVQSESGKGTRHKLVDFHSASRDGLPFETVIAKYGVPSKAFPSCSRELKIAPIHSYVKSLGWTKYETAIGIRADEAHRVNTNEPSYVYPLVEYGITKRIVNDWWEAQDFNLDIYEYQGNCDFCWKKSDKKLIRQINENRQGFEWWLEMEKKYQHAGNRTMRTETNFFFRGNRSGKELLALADEAAKQPNLWLSEEESDCFCKA